MISRVIAADPFFTTKCSSVLNECLPLNSPENLSLVKNPAEQHLWADHLAMLSRDGSN